MGEVESAGWVSVRCLFRWLRQGEQVYEERITVWRAREMDEAIARAEAEARTYAAENTDPGQVSIEYLGLAQAYLLADDLVDGAEVFSLLRVHGAEPEDHLDAFYDTGTERQQPVGGHRGWVRRRISQWSPVRRAGR